ncbi:MAG: arginyltransferase [Candidatus Omnitrophota bacterium]
MAERPESGVGAAYPKVIDKMSIKGFFLQPVIDECPYLKGVISINENCVVHELDDQDLETLLSFGFRHFGEVFFRPICAHCQCCVSIRVPVRTFSPGPSVRRLFKRNAAFVTTLETLTPSPETFELYKRHRKRFPRQSGFSESYESYKTSFFHPFGFNRMLTVRDNEKLVAVSHLDVTANAMSAVYCYYDDTYNRFSPGKFAIYKEIELAKEMGIQWLYLGYYIAKNRHTNYKINIKPNQIMTGGSQWVDYMDNEGNILNAYRIPTEPFSIPEFKRR